MSQMIGARTMPPGGRDEDFANSDPFRGRVMPQVEVRAAGTQAPNARRAAASLGPAASRDAQARSADQLIHEVNVRRFIAAIWAIGPRAHVTCAY